jgi:hypothetical protein
VGVKTGISNKRSIPTIDKKQKSAWPPKTNLKCFFKTLNPKPSLN